MRLHATTNGILRSSLLDFYVRFTGYMTVEAETAMFLERIAHIAPRPGMRIYRMRSSSPDDVISF